MNAVEILSRNPSQDFVTRFAECQQDVRKEPYRVGILPPLVWATFLKMPLPIPAEFWIARVAGRTVGRVGANVSAVYKGVGYIGFFEVNVTLDRASEAAEGLLSVACAWLRSQGVKKAYGPLDINTWFPYRFHVASGKGGEAFFGWEPVNPPDYVHYFNENGFAELERYHSQGCRGVGAIMEKTKTDYDRALAMGFTFRPFDGSELLDSEVPLLYDISMAGFQSNFLFEPIPLEAFRQLYVPIANKIDMSLARFVSDPEGKAVGFFFIFEDQGYMVLKSVAVLPEARGKGLSNALIHSSSIEAQKRGLDRIIVALVKSGAQSESYEKKCAPMWRHEYALFQRDL